MLCDGANGTPDLRDNFVLGAGGAHAAGSSGGALPVASTTGGVFGFSECAASRLHAISVACWRVLGWLPVRVMAAVLRRSDVSLSLWLARWPPFGLWRLDFSLSLWCVALVWCVVGGSRPTARQMAR